MNIGMASKATGVSAKMIRYYESIGLIKPAHRTDASYRVYLDEDIYTLNFIRRARDLGFSVDQMRVLLELWQDRSRASADVKKLAMDHVAELERKADSIRAMTATLRHLAETCHGDGRPNCPIIDGFANGITPTAADASSDRSNQIALRQR